MTSDPAGCSLPSKNGKGPPMGWLCLPAGRPSRHLIRPLFTYSLSRSQRRCLLRPVSPVGGRLLACDGPDLPRLPAAPAVAPMVSNGGSASCPTHPGRLDPVRSVPFTSTPFFKIISSRNKRILCTKRP